jgi:hypothetical protein
MGMLDKLLHRDSTAETEAAEAPVACPHGVLIPRWDNAQDMGREDRISSYRCDSCGEQFDPEEADILRSTTAARLRDLNEQTALN